MIRVQQLRREFVRPAEFHGRFASIRRLFSKRRVTKVAVEDVSFDIDAGYLGSNGAGKSTTIKNPGADLGAGDGGEPDAVAGPPSRGRQYGRGVRAAQPAVV